MLLWRLIFSQSRLLFCCSGREAKGFFGMWTFFAPRGSEDVVETQFLALRTYQYCGALSSCAVLASVCALLGAL